MHPAIQPSTLLEVLKIERRNRPTRRPKSQLASDPKVSILFVNIKLEGPAALLFLGSGWRIPYRSGERPV